MPSRSSKKQSPSRSSQPIKSFTYFRRHWIISTFIFITILLVSAVAALWYWNKVAHQQELADERIRFFQAEKDVDRITEAVTAAAGRPLKAERDKSCFLRSSKELKQPISCSIFSNMYYEVASDTQATDLYRKVKAATDNEFTFLQYRTDNLETTEQAFRAENISHTTASNGSEQIIIEGKGRESGMDCSMNYRMYETANPPIAQSPVASSSEYMLEVGFTCDADAELTYYPVK